MSAPLSAVLAAVRDGADTPGSIAARTGLDLDMVRTALEHLTRTGRLQARELTVGCPGGGCGSCASASPDGGPGCAAPAPETAGRRGLVSLSLRPRR